MEAPRLLEGVPPAWLGLLDLPRLDAIVARLNQDGAERLSPRPGLVFEMLRFVDPADVRVVLVGQDPYPDPDDAQGLCFSVPPGRPLPPSLQRVFGCLERAGLLSPGASGDLHTWAVQGVLMLNSALTTRAGERRAHADVWGAFVDSLILRFCAVRSPERKGDTPLHFLLWGGDARKHAAVARRHGHTVHEWSHPSPLADNKQPAPARFRACPHFEDVNADLARRGRGPIIWDARRPCVVFTDGSCLGNGKPGARASFAAVVLGGPFGRAVVRGEVRPFEYALVDEGRPERGVRPTETPAAPSNNRGELLGFIYGFLVLLRGRVASQVELVSDSEITLKTLIEWLPARRAKGTERELKNFDLVAIAERLLASLRGAAQVTLTHVRSHRPPPPESAPARVRLLHGGNALVDEQAGAALATPPCYDVDVESTLSCVRAIADAPAGPGRRLEDTRRP